jgi:hypothetical protein
MRDPPDQGGKQEKLLCHTCAQRRRWLRAEGVGRSSGVDPVALRNGADRRARTWNLNSGTTLHDANLVYQKNKFIRNGRIGAREVKGLLRLRPIALSNDSPLQRAIKDKTGRVWNRIQILR